MAGSFFHEMLGAELGFLIKTDKWRLESRHFPSKVGGKPAWLELKHLPAAEDVQCKLCEKPMTFLAQVYAPDDNDEDKSKPPKESCYHRTLYIFLCTRIECNKRNSNDNFCILRCQLAQNNEFYPPIDPPDDPDWKTDLTVEKFSTVCFVCGCSGTKLCGGCKDAHYCSKVHQLLHWKNGHKLLCNKGIQVQGEVSIFTIPEYEIIIEDEKLELTSKTIEAAAKNDKIAAELQEFNRVVKSIKPTFQDDSTIDESLHESVADVVEDEMFLKFKEKIANYPDQVMRYNKGDKPLWVSALNIPKSVPDCELCGAKRKFEFQIMSQMLNHLHLDNISDQGVDWGTLAVYACEDNCDLGKAYKKEWIWKQDYSK